MTDQFAGVVINELRRLENTINDVSAQLQGKKSLTQSERANITAGYTIIKDELRTLKDVGTVGGVRRERTDSEERFFWPAARKALIALRAPTNSNPLSSNWVAQLNEARTELSYYLDRLERELK